MKTGCVRCKQSGLDVTIPPSWIVEGEDRLSYTTIVRLIECCREYHWKKDILSKINKRKSHLDSICRSLSCEFIKPILVRSTIAISYCITEVRRKSYSLKFEVRNTIDRELCAEFSLVSVFYDPVTHKSLVPPPLILDYLYMLCSKEVNAL